MLLTVSGVSGDVQNEGFIECGASEHAKCIVWEAEQEKSTGLSIPDLWSLASLALPGKWPGAAQAQNVSISKT